jgi:hypothetical protein
MRSLVAFCLVLLALTTATFPPDGLASSSQPDVFCEGDSRNGYMRVPRLPSAYPRWVHTERWSAFLQFPSTRLEIGNLSSPPAVHEISIEFDGGGQVQTWGMVLPPIPNYRPGQPGLPDFTSVRKTGVWKGRLLPGETVETIPTADGKKMILLMERNPAFRHVYSPAARGNDQLVRVHVRDFGRVVHTCTFTAVLQ